MTPQSMNLPVAIGMKEQTVETQALLDCGASSEFMDSEFVKLHNIPLIKLRKPQITRNTDGTLNEQGVVTHKAIIDLRINRKEEPTSFFIAGLGKDNIILGLTWLRKHNPIVNWKGGMLRDRPHLSEVLRRKILAVTSVTLHQTPTDSERDFGNRLNHYPHFTSFPFPISSRILSQLLIHNLPLLLPYPCSVTAAPATELLPSINT
jgi:hypothetical protein